MTVANDTLSSNVVIQSEVLTKQTRIIATLTVAVPALITVCAIVWASLYRVSVVTLMVANVFYLLNMVGITVGCHRYFTHRAFTAGPVLRATFAILAMMGGQGPLLLWVAAHRRHHAYTEESGDCHSPLVFGDSIVSRLKGFWFAHIGWMFTGQITNPWKFARDLVGDRLVMKLNRYYFVWVAGGLVLPAIIVGVIQRSWGGAFEGLMWGGFVRMFLGQHMTWGINSLCHLMGGRTYDIRDNSRNVPVLALLTMGESWHHNHHFSPASANLSHRWYQVDVGYWIIRSLNILGLVSNVKGIKTTQ